MIGADARLDPRTDHVDRCHPRLLDEGRSKSLRTDGRAAVKSRVIDEDSRRFLIVDRFDRHGLRGRTGMASLLSLDADGTGTALRSWQAVTAQLQARGELSSEDHDRVGWLEAFGHLIANSDMHMGNLSVRLDGTLITGLAPVYDMLPMFHAPRHGVLVRDSYNPQAHHDRFPADAIALARQFWEALRDHPQRLGSMDPVCEAQLQVLRGAKPYNPDTRRSA